MQRELLLLSEMRDAAVSIRDLISGRSAEQVEADIDVETLVATAINDLPQMIAQLEDALSTLLPSEDHDPPA